MQLDRNILSHFGALILSAHALRTRTSIGASIHDEAREAVGRLPAKWVCYLRPLVNNSSECINRSHSDFDA
jgi:hypothetical protein